VHNRARYQHAISGFLLHAGHDLYIAGNDVCNFIVKLVHMQNAWTTRLAATIILTGQMTQMVLKSKTGLRQSKGAANKCTEH
jgi:hypothetical protein